MVKKLRVVDYTRTLSSYDIEGKAVDLQNKINAFLIGVSADAIIEDVSGYEEPSMFEVTSFRDETDAEYTKRLAKERKKSQEKIAKKQKLIEREKKELERLQKKYSGVV